MKRILVIITLALLLLCRPPTTFGQAGADTTFSLGLNWFSMYTGYNHNNWEKLWDDSMKFNVMHVGLDGAHAWVQAGGKGRLIVADTLSMDRFSHAGIMQYTPLEKHLTWPSCQDTLTHAYFMGRNAAYGYEGYGHWIDSSAAYDHNDKIILDKNEILNGDKIFQRMFRENNGTKFKVAVKMNVININTSSLNNAIEVWVKLFKWPRDSGAICPANSDSFIVYKEMIPWKKFTIAGKDSVFFTPDSAAFVFWSYKLHDTSHLTNWDSVPVNLDYKDSTNYLTEVRLEVHSRRWTETRIAWVSIQDINADSLLCGTATLDISNSALRHISDTLIRNEIKKDANTLRSSLTKDGVCYLYRFYLHDEPQTSEFYSQGRVNQLLNDSGETERANFQMRRFVSEASLPTFRSGDWGTGSSVVAPSPYYDHGPGYGCILCDDAALNKGRLHTGFGYFPFDSASGAYLPDSVYALSTDTSMSGPSTSAHCNDATKHSEHNFDIFDYGQYTVHPERSDIVDLWGKALLADSLVYLDTIPFLSPNSWVPNIFMNGSLKKPVWTFSDTVQHGDDSMRKDHPTIKGTLTDSGGYFWAGEPPIPEQLSLTANFAILMGAKGLFFWRDNIIRTDADDGYTPGFTNLQGTHDSDVVHLFGPKYGKYPFFFNRNTRWANAYSWNLVTHQSELFRARWIGAYMRRGTGTNSVDIQTVGLNPLVAPAGDSIHRRMLTSWVDSSTLANDSNNIHIKEVKLPDYMRYMAYGFFKNDSVSATKPMYYLAALSMVLDPRDLRCQWINDPAAADTHGYIMRGDRIVWTQMQLDSTISTYWRVNLVGSSNWETIIPYNGQIKQYYFPGEMKVYGVSPYCDYADRNPIDTLGVSYNNAVHMVRHSDEFRAVYVKNGAVYARKMSDCAVSGAKLVYGGGSSDTLGIQDIICPWWAGYPLPGSPGGGYSGDTAIVSFHKYWRSARTPAIAQHRGSAFLDEDLIVWEENGVDTTHFMNTTTTVTPFKCILARAMSFSGDTLIGQHAFVIADTRRGLSQSTSYWTTPSICANDSGYIISYGDSSAFIRFLAVQGHHGSYIPSQFNDGVTADSTMCGAAFPSIAWGSDLVTGIAGYVPLVQVVWQQYSSRSGKSEIYHQVIEVHYDSNSCPSVGIVPSIFPVEQVSHPNDPWNCGNYMPSISVDNMYSTSWTPHPLNAGHIAWHSEIYHPGLMEGRVTYYIWPGMVGASGGWNLWRGFASGVENFFEPGTYISPADSEFQTLVMTWSGNLDSMRSYVEGDTFLRTYGPHLRGVHPTLSYSLGLDYSPSTIFETVDTALHMGVVKTPVGGTETQSITPRSGEVFSVVISPQSSACCVNTCGQSGVVASIALPSTSIGIGQFQTLPILHAYPGNGTQENMVVATKCFQLQYGVPLVVQRDLAAKNTAALGNLLSTGVHPRALLELVDSTTGTVLIVLDSLVVTSSTDTLEHKGQVVYMPSEDFVGFPVYVRARILADSNVARWSLSTLTQFGWDTSTIGYAKMVSRDIGKGGIVPIADNAIDLIFYPSPANPRTRILYSVPIEDEGDVTEVRVFTVLGRDVTTLVSDIKAAGRYAVELDGTELRSGPYVVAVHTKTHMQSKMIVVQR